MHGVNTAPRLHFLDHRWRETIAEAVFPIYLLHQTLIVLAAWWLRPLALPPAAEAPC